MINFLAFESGDFVISELFTLTGKIWHTLSKTL